MIDRSSLLACAQGTDRLPDVEARLRREGLSLDLAAPFEGTVDEWIGSGAPGSRSPWLDPADHLVAGFVARLSDGRALEVRPAPRRAVGPDLFALFFGNGGAAGRIESVWLRVHPSGVARPAVPFERVEPVVSEAERALWTAIRAELTEKR